MAAVDDAEGRNEERLCRGLHEDSILNRQERRLLESIETTPVSKYANRNANHFNVFRQERIRDWNDKTDQPFLNNIPEVSMQGSYRDLANDNGMESHRSTVVPMTAPITAHETLDPFNPHLLPMIFRHPSTPLEPPTGAHSFKKTTLTSSRQLALLLFHDPTATETLNAPPRNPHDMDKISSATRSTAGNKSHELSEYVPEGIPLRHN